MNNIHAVSSDRHLNKRWKRPGNYTYTARDAIAPLTVRELALAVSSLPIGFISKDKNYLLVALQGLEPGVNALVAENGNWLGRYIPQIYRSYPFLFADSPKGETLLCVDEDSGLISDEEKGQGSEESDAIPFYDSDKKPCPEISEMTDSLSKYLADRQLTKKVCQSLQEKQLIKPWAIKLKSKDGGDTSEQSIDDLYCVDEQALNKLPAADLVELRDTGALLLAYSQLLSMIHLQSLAKIANAQQQRSASKEIILDAIDQGGSLSFDNL